MPTGIYKRTPEMKTGKSKPSKESKEKNRLAHLGKIPSEETRLKIGKANKGKVFSLESRNKISNSLKGNKNSLGAIRTKKTRLLMSLSKIGKQSPNLGTTDRYTPSTRLKMSISALKRISDGRHNTYKGGITPLHKKIRHSLEYKLWREAVFERDDYTCIWCEQKGGTLNADHIKRFSDFPELRFAIDNGRTLCYNCHRTTETYGNKKRQ